MAHDRPPELSDADKTVTAASPRAAAEARLQSAAEVLCALAKAQRGLALVTRAGSVVLRYEQTPAAEAAILEAAERLAGDGDLALVRSPMAVELSIVDRVDAEEEAEPRPAPSPAHPLPVLVKVHLRGRLLAQYRYAAEAPQSRKPRDDGALIRKAKADILRERLVDKPHLAELTFEVRRP